MSVLCELHSEWTCVSVISRPLRCDCRSCAGTVNLYMCVLASLVAIRRDVFNVCGDPPCRAPRAPILQTPKFVNVSANRRPKKGKRARTNKMLAAVATLLLAVPSLPDAEQQPLLPPPASSSSLRSSQASSPSPYPVVCVAEVERSRAAEYMQLMRDDAAAARAFPGVLRFDVLTSEASGVQSSASGEGNAVVISYEVSRASTARHCPCIACVHARTSHARLVLAPIHSSMRTRAPSSRMPPRPLPRVGAPSTHRVASPLRQSSR